MLSRLRKLRVHPLYIVTVALGLAAAFSVAGRRPNDDQWVEETLRAQHLKSHEEVYLVAALEGKATIPNLTDEERRTLHQMLGDQDELRGVIACSIMANFTATALMSEFGPDLVRFASRDQDEPIVTWTLSRWQLNGGRAIVQQLAGQGGAIAKYAAEIKSQ